jgi:putative Mg2+ transporter-C (MgtC) family protein
MPAIDLPWPLMGHLLFSALLGAIIGIERDLSGRPAGIRTNMIIAAGSCLFTVLSGMGYPGDQNDQTRIAAQIVSGIGFLGAGVLLKEDRKVLGLTTAADIWLVAAIGMAVGTGWYSLAVTGTLIAALGLPLLAPFSKRLEEAGNARMKRHGKEVVKEG